MDQLEPRRDPLEDAYNLAAALEQVDGDRAFFAELVGMFLNSLPFRMDDIRCAVDRGESLELRNAAHALKGALGYLRARPASDAAMRLEAIAEQADPAGVLEALCALEFELERLVDAVSSHIVAPARFLESNGRAASP